MEESFIDFMDSYDLASTSEGWTPQRKAKQQWRYLNKSARTYWSEQPDRFDWEKIKVILHKQFVPPEISRFKNDLLIQKQQKSGESIAEYATDITKLVSDAYPHVPAEFRKEILRSHFIRGLHPDMFFHVTSSRPGATYEEAFQLAQNYQIGKKLLQHNVGGFGKDNDEEQPQVYAGFRLQTRSDHRLNKSNYGNRQAHHTCLETFACFPFRFF